MDEGTVTGIFFLAGVFMGGILLPLCQIWIEDWKEKRQWKRRLEREEE